MNILEQTIGWLAPPVCIGCGKEGEVLCLACQESEIIPYGERCAFCSKLSPACRTCANCRRSGAPGHVLVATDYLGLSKDLLQVYKFKHQRIAAEQIAAVMVGTFKHFGFENDKYLIEPVPTATTRLRERGFDHTALLARQLVKKLNLPLSPALGRLGQSRQVGAQRLQRQKQLAGAYFVREPSKIQGQNVLLIDDVITTGATLREVYKILRAAGARRVDALVFAKKL